MGKATRGIDGLGAAKASVDLGSGGGPAATAGKTSWTCPGPGYTGDAKVPGTDTQDPGIPGTRSRVCSGLGCAKAPSPLP